ncbi:AraC family transcriptional regulator [Minwuia thermotolerans]|uniref:HTH araC/xylS-type domain-containing protein n=1 Tax=Minwuia thermotolerans TaxID=2056226 RepID=A0A2M9FXA3_9PROT|nr:AraC family transcriptional regulator [Minwuia thermotolerans]PJK28083.1 hypothetical protein CVT23_18785 [Minwuia thermotolerans]
MNEDIEIVARLLAIGVNTVIAAVFLAVHPRRIGAWLMALLAVSVVGYLWLSGPWNATEVPAALRGAVGAWTALIPFLVWVIARMHLEDGFRPGWIWIPGLFVAWLAVWLIDHSGEWQTALRDGVRIAGLGALIDVARRALQGRPDDLVALRRGLRLTFAAASVGITAVVLAVELILSDAVARAPLEPIAAVAILVMSTLSAMVLLRPRGELFVNQTISTRPHKTVAGDASAPDEDAELARRIEAHAAAGELFKPELSITALATELGAPEYRLRRAINRHLGYRNFPAFLNHYRIEEARRRFADPANDRLPILTIAMDLGYGSVGPFNRAFRELTGQTPSAFRRQIASRRSADS